MKLKLKLYFFKGFVFCLAFLSPCIHVKAQTPANDPHWEIDPARSDEFSGTSLDLNKWQYNLPFLQQEDFPPMYHTCFIPANVAVNNGTLKFYSKPETYNCTYHNTTTWATYIKTVYFTSGMVHSLSRYKYGYLEVKMKIPYHEIYKDDTRCYGPTLWLFDQDAHLPNGTSAHSEIDVIEFAGYNRSTVGVLYQNLDKSFDFNLRRDVDEPKEYKGDIYLTPYDEDIFSNAWHTYGCEWTPQYINFYRDDKLIRHVPLSFASDLIPMTINMGTAYPYNLFSDHSNFSCSTSAYNPYVAEVDHVRFYRLKMDCNTSINSCNYNFSSYDNKVKNTIILGGAGCSSKVLSNTSVTLRANQYLLFNAGFEVEANADFYASTSACE
jgi:beta-glucanase (GH16 family)